MPTYVNGNDDGMLVADCMAWVVLIDFVLGVGHLFLFFFVIVR